MNGTTFFIGIFAASVLAVSIHSMVGDTKPTEFERYVTQHKEQCERQVIIMMVPFMHPITKYQFCYTDRHNEEQCVPVDRSLCQ